MAEITLSVQVKAVIVMTMMMTSTLRKMKQKIMTKWNLLLAMTTPKIGSISAV